MAARNSKEEIRAAYASTGPKGERGTESGYDSGLSWATMSGGDEFEAVPELQWPNSVIAYRKMLNDAQANSLIQGLLLPVRSYRFYLDKNNARDDVVQRISRNYNLPVGNAGDYFQLRGQRRFSFKKHLEDALRALTYGHFPFEQVGEIVNGKWTLRKLGVRSPLTLTEINVDTDGGLKSIRQATGPNTPILDVSRLLYYVWDREGAQWTGKSMLRPLYRNYLVKDRILRVGAINIERAGGVPYVEAPEGTSADQIRELDYLARRFRVGEAAGAALPHGAQLKFAAAAGGDASVNYIKLQNEEMARSMLQMFQTLGQSSSGSGGSHSLGSDLIDYFSMAQETVAQWFCDIFNEHMIEDDVEWNEGSDEEYAPLLKFSTADADEPTAGLELALGEDEGIEDSSGVVATAIHHPSASGRSKRRKRTTQAAMSASPMLPGRPLRRKPYDHEVTAAVNYQELDATFESTLTRLLADLNHIQDSQIDDIYEAIINANGDLSKITKIKVVPGAQEVLLTQLITAADVSMHQAVQEAARQGVTITRPEVEVLIDSLDARASAVDTLLANNLAQSAQRNALRLTEGKKLTVQEVAATTSRFLRSLTGVYAKEVLSGVVQTAVNAARYEVFDKDGEVGDIYASELLDTNTCSACANIDGTHYENLVASSADYPTGGYKNCEGRERCRGTIIKVYKNEEPSTLETPYGR